MGAKYVDPTRMELTHLKKKLTAAIRGHKLLKDKRDELMHQFLDLVRENKAFRERVEVSIAAANRNFVLVRSGMTNGALNVALMAPKQKIYLETETKNAMSVEIPVFKYKIRTSDPNDIYSYGSALTSSDLDDAVKNLVGLLPDILRLAEHEKPCQLMATEIEKIRRHVNALEHMMVLDVQSSIHYITMKLDENERSSWTGPIKAKDIMLEEVHHCSEREVAPVVDEVQQVSS